ncbi:TetR family transcriptional regulator [Actinomycetospora lutea]|uniref:TetR/AcrR family transcriptional regulator n=1 Tax=Actinomycetospora lutea TaxID=663604 RepID=UPI002366DDC6|nr:TetR family transcriptional regulator [Actinomycetospora lutea]MDD7940768.1 TetR family transcriptional regulator [Actinomycetospora lutea]
MSEGSARQQELLEAAYAWVLDRGWAGMSLRPLAEAIGSSPRVLLFLFGSKDGLVRALLARSRADQLAVVDAVGQGGDLAAVGGRVWAWLAAPEHRALLRLWLEGYTRSVADPGDGPWAGFAARTVADWDALLADHQPAPYRDTPAGAAERTLLLAVLRGALLDLLATGDTARLDAAVAAHLARL